MYFLHHCECPAFDRRIYVKSGEKIETIAAQHGVTPEEILEANGLISIAGKKYYYQK
ncbi:LysM domain-containing protein [Neobacillus sp. DY30]|uniref:LysM peptidoglycan-binding domain-containing protein n=1 Tax=Neobacillus sp. DY30 TaxID=3047871 RepID=UPI0024BF3DF1|nr:LysM domain-containing protein [Neobacillus sp. DY30]WHY00404.1 LysM domain-containing protein [Neobacillus sp. DY30]